MSKIISIELTEEMHELMKERVGCEGGYGSLDEYVCDLIRHDLEYEEHWAAFEAELLEGLEAPREAFKRLSAEDIIAEGKLLRDRRHGR